MLQNHILLTQSPTPTNRSPHPSNASAKRPPNDRTTSASLPLSQREQQVCENLSQGRTFEAIARDLGFSQASAKEYYRRALDKHQRTIALTPLEQSDRPTPAQPKPTSAEPPGDRPSSVRLERPNPLDLCVPDLFVTGEPVALGQKSSKLRSHSPQTTITDPRHPRRRNRPSRCNRRAGVGDRMAAAS
jgi:DNA-binding CsgD family transcriptional regulator